MIYGNGSARLFTAYARYRSLKAAKREIFMATAPHDFSRLMPA
jgi:hypothetical protein